MGLVGRPGDAAPGLAAARALNYLVPGWSSLWVTGWVVR
jgi:hypothetical protein